MLTGDKRKIRRQEIVYLSLSVILFLANCFCAFQVTASIAEVFTERELVSDNTVNTLNIFTEIKPIEVAIAIEVEAEEAVTEIIDYIEYIEIEEADIVIAEAYEETAATVDIIDIADAEWRYELTEYEVNLVAAVAMLEDMGAMEAIAEVILNRVESEKFEQKTVDGIIYAKGQFYVANRISADNITANEEAINAVLAVFKDGVSVVGGAEFFAEKSVNPQKIAKGLYLIDSIGSTNFYGQK